MFLSSFGTLKLAKWQLLRSGRITQNIDLGYACFQEKYYRVCIARAPVNKSVREDSHAEFAMVIYKTKMTYVYLELMVA